MKLLITFLVLFTPYCTWAQAPDAEILQKEIRKLAEAAKNSFSSIKTESTGNDETSGNDVFSTSLSPSGAKSAIITADEENSHTYIALFEANSEEEAFKMAESIANAALEALKDKGFKLAKGMDTKFYKYKKFTVEFGSDNINELGRHPSISIGILEDNGKYLVEFSMNEPLWK